MTIHVKAIASSSIQYLTRTLTKEFFKEIFCWFLIFLNFFATKYHCNLLLIAYQQ